MAWQLNKNKVITGWAGKQQRFLVAAVVCSVGLAGGQKVRAQTDSAPFVFEGQVLRIDQPGWESSGEFLVAEPAVVEVASGVNAHLRGAIKAVPGSPNGLSKLGGGTLQLSGTNSYRGVTQLLQGGLHVDGPSVFGLWGGLEAIPGTHLAYSQGVNVARPLTLSDTSIANMLPEDAYTPLPPVSGLEGAVGWRVNEGRATHSGLLQGKAELVKLGEGTLDITGDAMAYTGLARVAEGSLAVNEIFSGAVRVQSGARLEGTGSVGALHVASGAVLAPGQGVGVLSVAGDAYFEPGSRYEVQALETGESDFTWVRGTALLDGEVVVLAQEGLWETTVSYPILTAQNGFGQTQFASVSSDLAFLTPSLAYGSDTVTLTLQRNDIPVGSVGETPDEEAVGNVIDEDTPVVVVPDPVVPEPVGPDEVVVVVPDQSGGGRA